MKILNFLFSILHSEIRTPHLDSPWTLEPFLLETRGDPKDPSVFGVISRIEIRMVFAVGGAQG